MDYTIQKIGDSVNENIPVGVISKTGFWNRRCTQINTIILTLIWFHLSRDYFSQIIRFNFPLFLVIGGSIYAVFFNGLLEEIFWRGYIYSKCFSVKNRVVVMFINAVFFVSFHVFIILAFLKVTMTSFIIIGLIFLAGILFSFLREKSLSIIPSVVLHFLISIGYILVFLFLYFS